jgi:hypothetical protein
MRQGAVRAVIFFGNLMQSQAGMVSDGFCIYLGHLEWFAEAHLGPSSDNQPWQFFD